MESHLRDVVILNRIYDASRKSTVRSRIHSTLKKIRLFEASLLIRLDVSYNDNADVDGDVGMMPAAIASSSFISIA